MNSAGSSLAPHSVMTAIVDYLREEEQVGGYEVERLWTTQIGGLYESVAQLLNCQPHNIAYAYSATDAYSRTLSAIPFKEGDYILTTDDDYISNQIAFLSLQQRLGIKLLRANNLATGDLDLSHVEQLIRDHHPVLVAVTHVPTNSGLVQPAEEIGIICRRYGVWYLLDACQSVGQLPVDVTRIGCDFLNVTGRKFLRGPRNTGFLYVSNRVLQAGLTPLFIDRRGAAWTETNAYQVQAGARRFEPQEVSAFIVGLAEAVRYANEIGIEAIAKTNEHMLYRLRTKLEQIDGLHLLDRGSVRSNILTFHTNRQSLSVLEAALTHSGIVYTVQHQHYALIDFMRKGVNWAIRLSPHYFNTLEEIDTVVDVIARVIAK